MPDILGTLDLRATVLHLGCAIVMGQILAWHYVRYARVLSNRRKFARIFVFIAGTTLLMISVVKTSLELSLGLVGALSIIRFRTPIKEPEELAYLFLAIAIGVGLGANQLLTTAVIFAVLLVFLALMHGGKNTPAVRTLLQVSVPTDSSSASLDKLVPIVESACSMVDVRRVDSRDARLEAALAVEVAGASALSSLLEQIHGAFDEADITLVERDVD